MDSTVADMLILGSSRASHHYYPEIFEDSLKLTYYNTGRDGAFILYHCAVLKSILKRHTPKLLIFDINHDELASDQISYDHLSSLLPYYSNHPEIRSIVAMRGPYEKWKMFSATYPYNSGILSIVAGNLKFNSLRGSDRKGFIPLFNRLNDTTTPRRVCFQAQVIDPAKLTALKFILQACRTKKIKLVIIQSPWFLDGGINPMMNEIRRLAEKNGALFFDFSHQREFLKKPGFFNDVNHLNETGARYFSSIVASTLKLNINSMLFQPND